MDYPLNVSRCKSWCKKITWLESNSFANVIACEFGLCEHPCWLSLAPMYGLSPQRMASLSPRFPANDHMLRRRETVRSVRPVIHSIISCPSREAGDPLVQFGPVHRQFSLKVPLPCKCVVFPILELGSYKCHLSCVMFLYVILFTSKNAQRSFAWVSKNNELKFKL